MRQFLALLILTALLAFSVFAASAGVSCGCITCTPDHTTECTSINGAVGIVQATIYDPEEKGLMVVWAINGQYTRTDIVPPAPAFRQLWVFFVTNEFGLGTNDVSVGVSHDGTNF